MTRKLRDITLYCYDSTNELNKQFTTRQNVIADLYVHFLNGYKPPKTTRLSVTLRDQEEILNKPYHLGSIAHAEIHFNKATFWNNAVEDQKRIILDAIHSAALSCIEHFGWNKDFFIRSHKRVLDANYVFKTESQLKLSPDKRLQAGVTIEKTEEKTIIRASIHDRAGKPLYEIPLFESFQSDMFYGGMVKYFKWFGNDEFGVYSKTGQIKIIADLKTGKSRTCIEPKTTPREELEAQLRSILFTDVKTHADMVAWMNK